MLIMVFLSFIMSLFVAIQDPIIQKFAIRIAGGYLSQKTGADVRIGRLYIDPDFTISIDHFLVKDLQGSTLLGVEELRVRPIMEDIIHGNIHVGRVELNEAEANLITYEDSTHMNFQFLIDAFATGEKKKSDKTTAVTVDRILLRNLDFQLWNQNKYDPEKTAKGLMDYSHLVLDNINLDMEFLNIVGDSITALIHHLAASEASGFRLNDLVTEVVVSPKGIFLDDMQLMTANSSLDLDLHMLYDGFSAFGSFVDSVDFDTRIYPTDITLSDFGPFTEALQKMPDKLHLEGRMKGPIKNFTLDQLKLNLGQRTHFEGNLAMQPLDLNNRIQVLNIKKLDYDIDDIASFNLPIPTGTIPLPEVVHTLGHGTIKGQFKGSMNKFKTNLAVTSEVGDVSVMLNRFINDQHCNVFEGYVEADRINAGLLANAPKVVGTLDLTANVIARQERNGGMDLDIDGEATHVELLGNNIDNILLNGNLNNQSFDGKVNIVDNLVDLDFKGFVDFSNPKALSGNFQANIDHIDLRKLNLVKDDSIAILQASITADVSNINNFNQTEGTLSIKDLAFSNSKGNFAMHQFDASIINDQLMQKRINVDCDILDFEMAGLMDFNTLGIAFKRYIDSYVTFPQWTEELALFEESGKSAEQDFIIDLNIKDPEPLTRFLMPSVTIADNTTLNGTFTTKSQSLNVTLRSDYVMVNKIKIDNILCKSRSNRLFSSLRFDIDQVVLRDSTEKDSTRISLDDLNLVARLQNDSIKTTIGWDDFSMVDHNKADIHASFIPSLTGGRLNISRAEILLNDSLWTIDPNNYVVIDGDKIQISNLELISEHQNLHIDGYAPMQEEDTLSVNLQQFNLASLGFLLGGGNFSINGFVNGNATINNLKNEPTLFADLDVKDFGLNGVTYGDAEILSRWNNEQSAIELAVGLIHEELKVLNVSGAYYTARKDDNLDFTLDLDQLDMSILSPFLNGIVHRMQGQCSGHATVKGAVNKPNILGQLKVTNGGCKVDFLNTFYTFEPTITLTEGLITLNNFSLVDTLGNSALVAGQITHNYLKDMAIDIRMYPNNFLAMATTAHLSPTFYGTAIASGIVTAKGPTNNLKLTVKAMTRKGTVMTIPLGGASSVKQHEFITFVDKHHKSEMEEEPVAKVAEKPKNKGGLDLELDLSVNNDAQVKIALPNGLGSMEAKGEGNIQLGLPPNSNMSLIGDYVINSGSLTLNIQNMLRRNFSLEPGSSISWTGDAVNGTINATGVYQTKAALSSLGLADSTSTGSNNVKVDCLVHLKNKLMNPDISFGIRLPNASEDMKQAVFYVVDTTNQAEMLVQAIYLMVFNSFNYNGSSTEYYNIITNQLNDIISQLTDDIDINVNYKPGGEMSNEEMTVALRKQLFDDRLTIETNFGVVRPTAYSTNSTNIVGDFNIDYKITKDGRLSGQVFNRSNYNTVYYQYTYYKMAPYTQGIGLSYSKNFDTFRDLFRKRTNNLNLPNRPVIDRPRGALNQNSKPNSNPNQNQSNAQPTE